MARSKYFDEKLGKEFIRVQVVRKSVSNPKIVVRKRQDQIESETEAIKIEKNFIREAEREVFAKEQRGMSWLTLIDEFELALRDDNIFTRKLGAHAQYEYIQVLRKYTEEWFDLHISDIDKAKAWLLLDRVQREVSIGRGKRLRTAIDSLYSWGMLSGRIQKTVTVPTEGFRTVRKEEEPLPEILNISQIRTLLSYAKQIDHEWYPIWAMALHTGMRSGELFALEWAYVDFDSRLIYIHKNWTNKEGYHATKGRYWRSIWMNDELIDFLKKLKLKMGESKYVLPHLQKWEDGEQAEILRQFCIGAGLPSIKFHTLRACFATQLIKDGVAPAVVMKICGWKDLKTMQKYIRLAGIEIKDSTAGLKLLPEEAVMGRVYQLFNGSET